MNFGRALKYPGASKTPVVVVTGFLGAGKTTLIRNVLAKPEGRASAIVVNEFGEVGIDDALLRASSDSVTLLGNGCLCCSVRTDLQEALRSLVYDRSTGRVPSFVRVIIETSGLADPGPVLQTFATDRALGGEFYLRGLVAVVDAAAILQTLAGAPEARKQILLADRIAVTKSDLVSASDLEAVVGAIGALNARAEIRKARDGEIDPDFILDNASAAFHAGTGFHADHAAHSEGVESFALIYDKPIHWSAFEAAMNALAMLRGPDLLRVKGLLCVEGCDGPVVVQFVQHLSHPPTVLQQWPTSDHRSRLVFITRGIGRAKVEKLLTAMQDAVDA